MSALQEIPTVTELIEVFRDSRNRLIAYRDSMFPRWSVVKHRGAYTIVSCGDGLPPDQVALIFENGSTWWKRIEECERVNDLKTLPKPARQMVLRFHRINTLDTWPRRNGATLP